MVPAAGLNAVADIVGNEAGADAMNYIAYGTGTTAASSSDTTLGTETARIAATVETTSILYPNDTAKLSAAFTASGSGTITEAGMLNKSAAGDLFARQVLTTSKSYVSGSYVSLVGELTVKDNGAATGATW